MSSGWQIRQATEADGEGITRLFEEVFQEECPISRWRWKYVENHLNRTYTFLAEDNGRIVGHCSLLPTWMSFQGGKTMAAQRVDSMVHPDYRRRGILVSLAKECYARAAAEGVAILYHFPNEQSYSLSIQSLDSHRLGRLPQFVRILDARAIIERRIHSPAIASLSARPVRLLSELRRGNVKPESKGHVKIVNVGVFDSRFDGLWLAAKDRFGISVWKDSNYLNWRYVSCPDRQYHVLAAEEQNDLTGFMVLMSAEGHNKVGRIVDFLSVPGREQAESLLVSAGLEHLRGQGADMVSCHVFGHSPLCHLLRQWGFFRHGEGFDVVVRALGGAVPSSTLLDMKQWHLAGGDIDVF